MDEWNISVDEVMKITHKSRDFIINAIQQGVFPGSVVKHVSGRRCVYIPRKAFMDYMEKWNSNPSKELVSALVEVLNNLTTKQLLQLLVGT